MNHQLRFFLSALPVFAGSVSAKIDSGGGKVAVGNLTNHGSIGGFVATDPSPPGCTA